MTTRTAPIANRSISRNGPSPPRDRIGKFEDGVGSIGAANAGVRKRMALRKENMVGFIVTLSVSSEPTAF